MGMLVIYCRDIWSDTDIELPDSLILVAGYELGARLGENSESIIGHKNPTTPNPKTIPVTNRNTELSELKWSPA